MKILVVDDELDVRSLFLQRFRKEIKQNKIDFVFALSGSEALELLECAPEPYKLILSDINMPGMTGLELLSRIRKDFGETTPVVMMITAYSDETLHRQAIESGANDYLTKPVDFNILKEKLKAYT